MAKEPEQPGKPAEPVATKANVALSSPVSMEEALSASQQRLSGIVDNADDAIICIDAAQVITLFNHGAEKVFGYAAQEVIGKPLAILIPGRYRANHAGHVRSFGEGPAAASKMGSRGQITGLRKDGTEFPAEATILRQHDPWGLEFTTILRDASERRRIEDELEQRVAERTHELRDEMRRHQESQAAVARLQRMESLGQLTGGIAHDFNNLLTVVSGNLELIGMDLADERSLRYLDEAQRAIEMGARLNQRLMTFAKQRKLAPASINLNEQVIGVRELLRRALGETITLTTDLADELWTVRADASEVENALLNLAVNSRDAMPGGGQLILTTSNVTVTPGEVSDGLDPGDYVVLSVADTGSGMTSEVMSHVFEPFFTTKEPGKGTGLGLATVYGFVKQSGGHVRMESQPGRGTIVSIYLPRVTATLHRSRPASEARLGPDPHAHTILVVEDNRDVRRVTMERVRALGYEAIECASGRDAIPMLERDNHITLVFSDIIMPGGLSGFDLARECRTRWPHIRVLLTSGYSALEAGRDASIDVPILEKPYSQHALSAALSKALLGR